MNPDLRFGKAMQDAIRRESTPATTSNRTNGLGAMRSVRSALGNALIRAGTRVRPSPDIRTLQTSKPY